MIFNSFEFALFLPLVFVLYWFVLKGFLKAQNFFLVGASYIFYGWWDWRFLSLIVISSFVDFVVGLYLDKTEKKRNRKILLAISLITNLGLLGFFKYYNFFLENLITAFDSIGITLHPHTLQIVLPVGISFYTFQTLSYTIDVYRKKMKPTDDPVAFFAYVSFFPQLVAGPIERAAHLLPQFARPRVFQYDVAITGMRLILWGLFKKVVIADGVAPYVDEIFNNSEMYSGPMLLLGTTLFAFQIYGDFSGYSDIAIGVARLFGFDLMKNFNLPYFSRDIAEFWRRWHISLSTWFRDYLYIPLGGSRTGKFMRIRNIVIVFTVSGFWHGANWTFIFWGLLNGLYYIPLMLANSNRSNLGIVAANSVLPSFRELFQILLTFFLTIIAWVFFRAENMAHAISYVKGIFLWDGIKSSIVEFYNYIYWQTDWLLIGILLLFIIIEWSQRRKAYLIDLDFVKSRPVRVAMYYSLVVAILYYYSISDINTFIYFQF